MEMDGLCWIGLDTVAGVPYFCHPSGRVDGRTEEDWITSVVSERKLRCALGVAVRE